MRQAIVHPLPVGLVVDGEVVDSDGLALQLRSMFEEHGLPREVRVGLAHPRLMVRLVELPSTLDGTDLDGAVRHLATDLLPVGLDQLVVDYRRLGGVPGAEGAGKQRVLMAAARVDGIERLTRALDAAGLRSQSIGLSGLAMVSALTHAPLPGEAILYVQAGALTNVVITEDGQPLLVRAASAGSEAIATGLAERAGISHEAARAHIASIGLGTGTGAASTNTDELETNVAQQVREGLRRVIAEVQSSRGVYSARPDACAIGGVVLTGSMMTWPGVVQALEDELHLPVIVADRATWPQIDGLDAAPERLDVVVGLSRGGDVLRPDLRPTGSGTQSRRPPIAAPPKLVLQVGCGMLALVAVAIVYMVILSNQVSGGREDLRDIATNLQQSEQEAAALKPYSDFVAATQKRHDAVASVAKTRFKWDRTMTELARVAPKGVWLTSAKATLTPATQVEGGAGATSGLRNVLSVPAIELVGCASSEKAVPAYIDRLHRMTGVTDVAFSRTAHNAKDGATTGANGCQSTGKKSSSFELVTYFKQQSAPLPPGATTTTTPAAGAAAPATASTPPTAPANQTAAATTGGTP